MFTTIHTRLMADGETLDYDRELCNRSDPFSSEKRSKVVRNIPRHYSCVFSLFLCNDGDISYCVSRGRCYSRDIPQGGLEIPCIYMFKISNHDILDKTKKCQEQLEASTYTYY